VAYVFGPLYRLMYSYAWGALDVIHRPQSIHWRTLIFILLAWRLVTHEPIYWTRQWRPTMASTLLVANWRHLSSDDRLI